MSDIMAYVFGLSILAIMIGVFITYLRNLARLVDEIRDDSLLNTQIHKAWVWTQLIPAWSFIAQIVFNIKLEAAARAVENKYSLPNKTITYPSILGWIIAIGFLYSWIPGGSIIFLICLIMYWVKISATTKQLQDLKSTNTIN